jgi:hypothetical protein
MTKYIVILCTLLLFSGCKYFNSDTDKNEPEVYIDYTPEKSDFTDGRYLAEVEFYDPVTDKSMAYQLEVAVVGGLLSEIYWADANCPDTSHFALPDISDGAAAYESAAGFEYKVRLLHQLK